MQAENVGPRGDRFNFFPCLTQNIHLLEQILHGIFEFAHIRWETTKRTIVLTANKSVTRFYWTKSIPAPLWNASDYVFQFDFEISHIADSVNEAFD